MSTRPSILIARNVFPEVVAKLREHFEVNRHYIVVAALKALSEDGAVPVAKVAEAIAKYGINADKVNPLYA